MVSFGSPANSPANSSAYSHGTNTKRNLPFLFQIQTLSVEKVEFRGTSYLDVTTAAALTTWWDAKKKRYKIFDRFQSGWMRIQDLAMDWNLPDALNFVVEVVGVSAAVETIVVNFTNVLRAAFMRAYPKKLLILTLFSALLGSACVKAARRMLVKLTPSQCFLGET